MDEIGQDPKLNLGFPRGRWLDVAVAVALIAAAVLVVMTCRGSRPAAAPAAGPATATAPALLPSTVRARIPMPFGQSATDHGGTILVNPGTGVVQPVIRVVQGGGMPGWQIAAIAIAAALVAAAAAVFLDRAWSSHHPARAA